MSVSPMMPLRAVVVGAGLMGRFHTAAVASAGGVIAAVVDTIVNVLWVPLFLLTFVRASGKTRGPVAVDGVLFSVTRRS